MICYQKVIIRLNLLPKHCIYRKRCNFASNKTKIKIHMKQQKYKKVLKFGLEGVSIGLVLGIAAGYFYFFK